MKTRYKVIELIYESGRTQLWRGQRREDGLPVVIKRPRPKAAIEEGVFRLRREYDLLSRIDLPGVIKVLDYQEDADGPFLVMEDIGGEDLDRFLAGTALDLPHFFPLACGLADTLAGLHRQGAVHKDVNPGHIIYNPANGEFRLIGFGHADELPQSHIALQPPASLGVDLAYISPEATGRMNRPVDYRTDFYSLGAVFYRILTGRPPFQVKDALGLIHSHIASLPLPPRAIAPDIPHSLSRIVMKLLAKGGEDRYRSGAGLLADLNRCAAGETDFEPGSEDLTDRLQMPRNLYGRDKEIKRLLASFDRVCAGRRELLLVAGFAGVGKTALVHEMDKVLAIKRGHFIEGKFEQLQRSVPYFAWIQAFTGFVNYLLMESDEALSRWQEIIREAVGNLGKVLIEVIPNLELVIGPQPDVLSLGGAEAQNRFEYLFLRFIRALAAEEHPLVVFLDDLQWIDAASLILLQTLFSSPDVVNLLVIGAYRDNEVDAAHPLTLWIETMQREQRAVEVLHLDDLSEESVNSLIADTLHEEQGHTRQLSGLIYGKTGGNPFFLLQTLMALAERQAIVFDSGQRCWQWDMEMLQGMAITDNVVGLMLEKLGELPPASRDLLPLAACLGFRFETAGLSIIAGQPAARVLEALRPALRQGLLLPEERYFRFSHDRVQQASYTLLPEVARREVHWRIGQRLLREIAPQERNGHLFDIVNHLNIGACCRTTSEETRELADLNRQAGGKAKIGSAFRAALEYFESGLALIGDAGWDIDYGLSLLLHQEAAEASCLCGRYERMTELISVVKARAHTVLDTVAVCRTEIRALTAQGQLLPAIRSGLQALELLGLHLAEEPSAAEVGEAMARTLDLLQQRTVAGLADLPLMTEPEQLARLALLSEIGEPAYAASPHFFLVWAASMAELALRHGNSLLSPFAFAAFALALCATGEIEAGTQLSRTAIALVDCVHARSLRCRLLNIHGCTIQPWTEPLRDTLATLAEAVGAGTESGDFTSASYAAFNSCTAAFFMGEPLEDLNRRISTALQVIACMRQTYIWNWVAFHAPLIRRLHGDGLPPGPDGFDEGAWLAAAREANDRCGLAYYFLGKLVAAYLLSDGEYADVRAHITEIKANMAGFQGAFAVPVFSFYLALSLLEQHGRRSAEDDAAILDEVRDHLARLEGLAGYAPMNFRHKCDLIAAGLARIQGDGWRAAGLYEKAIAGARENAFLQEEALAHELAARLFLAHGREETARLHLDVAYQGYVRWQAFAKVAALEAEHPWLKRLEPEGLAPVASLLDLESVLKVTRAMSGVIEINRLLDEIMRIVIENAGAQSGFLLRESDGAWRIAARGEVGGGEVRIPTRKPAAAVEAVSAGVIHFVARTRKTVVLDDAQSEGNFIDDPHIKREKTRSLLALPLANRGRLLGILYMVNNLATRVFTKERLQLLEILAAQAAISLETADVYAALRESEERMRLTLSATRIGTWDWDVDRDIWFASPVYYTMLGYEAKEGPGDREEWITRLHPEDRAFFLEKINDVLIRHFDDYQYEARLRHADGSYRWQFVKGFGVRRDEAGRVTRMLGVRMDIHERKMAEEALRENEMRYRLGQSAAHIGTWEYDLVNDRFWGSDEAKRIYGFASEAPDFSVTDVEECIPERLRVHQALVDLIEKGLAYNLEFEIRPADGSETRIISSVAELYRDRQGLPVKVVGVIQDITERKRAEEELRRLKDGLESLVRERTVELETKNTELERMNQLFVGRELRMIELKKQIKELEKKC